MIDSQNSRLFLEATWNFGEIPEWFQVIPGPGKWKHPNYGEITITEKVLKEFVKNFKSGVYQEHIPIDAEHETKLSGACGYYKDIKVGGPKGEDGLWAQAEWNERGTKLLEEERYKYFSPEWYEEWTDPATSKTYHHLLVGGALTTRPFFKDGSLKPLVASEGFMWAVQNEEGDDKWEEMEKVVEKTQPKILKFKIGGTNMGENMVLKLTPEQVKSIHAGEDIAFTEEQLEEANPPEADVEKLQGKVEMSPEITQAFTEQKAENKRLSDELKRATEEVTQMKRDGKRREFREFIKANRAAFQGEVDENVDTLEKLADHLPEDLFADLQAEKHSLHERVMASGIFRQESVEGHAPMTAAAEIEAKAAELVKSGVSKADAMVKIASENPELANRYDKEHKARIRQGGE